MNADKKLNILTSTKIVATIGPSSSDLKTLKKLYQSGVNVFRLNFSHGTHIDHKNTIDNIRAIEKEYDKPIAIMADLQGPKLRVGIIEDDSELIEGQSYTLHLDTVKGNNKQAQLPHKNIFSIAKTGERLLIDDGKIELTITAVEPKIIHTKVTVAGIIKSNKGVNVPDAILDIKPLTTKDKADLTFALEQHINIFALSFVQKASDVEYLRTTAKTPIKIVSKLEKPAALNDLHNIVAASDIVMVARGDLGVELKPSAVPAAQLKIVRESRLQGKPVIIATQMLESMTELPVPTRAEASDVANAIYSGVDAVMLSGETAAGKYPIETVKMMKEIIHQAEQDLDTKMMDPQNDFEDERESLEKVSNAISCAVKTISDTLDCHSIASFTSSGHTCAAIAKERPNTKQITLTDNKETAKYISFIWGARSIVAEDANGFNDIPSIVRRELLKEQIAKENDLVVITAGVPFGTPGKTNLLLIENL